MRLAVARERALEIRLRKHQRNAGGRRAHLEAPAIDGVPQFQFGADKSETRIVGLCRLPLWPGWLYN